MGLVPRPRDRQGPRFTTPMGSSARSGGTQPSRWRQSLLIASRGSCTQLFYGVTSTVETTHNALLNRTLFNETAVDLAAVHARTQWWSSVLKQKFDVRMCRALKSTVLTKTSLISHKYLFDEPDCSECYQIDRFRSLRTFRSPLILKKK